MNLGIITSVSQPELLPYDKKYAALLHNAGLKVSTLVWDGPPVDINQFDALIFRTAWGYHNKIRFFTLSLSLLEKANIKVWNPIDVIRDNIHKSYLNNLARLGVSVIPTRVVKGGQELKKAYFEEIKTDQVIIKPAISAGSKNTNKYNKEDLLQANAPLIFDYDVLIQPYLISVESLGEYSMVCFASGYSFCVVKVPQKGNFLVQKQFGGKYEKATAPAAMEREVQKILGYFRGEFLYIRIDGLLYDDNFWVMEVEMIEPDLYLDIVPEGIEHFAESTLMVLNR